MKKASISLRIVLFLSIFYSLHAQTAKDSWNFGFGFTYPRFQSTDVRPQESNYGGYISLQRYFSESVSLRIKGSYLSMEGRIPGGIYRYTNGTLIPSVTEYMRTNLMSGNADVLYNFAPCSPVSPYAGMGFGAASFTADWPENVVNADAQDSKLAVQVNLVFGAEWRFSSRWKMISEFELHSIDGQFDGIINNNKSGIFGSNSDGYIAASLGFQYYFSKGEPSKYCDLYDGLTVEIPEANYPTLDEIEQIVKRYASESVEVDYNRIEDIIKKHKSSVGLSDNWVLFGVNFEFAQSNLTPESYPILEHAVEVLKENPDLHLEIQGHTDNIGSESYNQTLSEARANTVREYLTDNGIANNRLTTIGFGESKPISDNTSASGRAKNRRVEFKVSK